MPRWTNENAYDVYIHEAALEYGVPSELIKAVIGQESAFRANAYRAEPKISDASIGLMQILYGTAKGEGYTGQVGDSRSLTGLYAPATNIKYGTSFLAAMLQRAGGRVASGISAYNGGYRPELGFGEPATRPITICLARDSSGKCIQTRNVPVGEYANQPYVNAVLSNYNYFLTQQRPPISSGGGGVPPSPLAVADQRSNESEVGRRIGGTPHRTVLAVVRQALVRLLSRVMGRSL